MSDAIFVLVLGALRLGRIDAYTDAADALRAAARRHPECEQVLRALARMLTEKAATEKALIDAMR